MSESLLEFYKRHGISPVRQRIDDLRAHFGRRAALYRHLGILPMFVRGKTAVEIGPGSGFNSLYTASLGLSRYVLVEPNPQGIAEIRELFAMYPEFAEHIEVVPLSAEQYVAPEAFDFVFCEGVLALAGLPDPAPLLRSVAAHTAPGGVVVITCIDAISDFSEVLRRYVAHRLIDPAATLGDQVARLLPAFAPHLATLRGMTRRHDDWIVDNLLSPASIGPLLSIPDAIAALDGEFDVYGASPRFLVDWRWYKAIAGESDGFNDRGIRTYWATVHNLLDFRGEWIERDPAKNRELYSACTEVRNAVRQYEQTRDSATNGRVLSALQIVESIVAAFSPATADAVAEVASLIASDGIDPAAVAASRAFAPWFGRGQQYLSFSRRQQ